MNVVYEWVPHVEGWTHFEHDTFGAAGGRLDSVPVTTDRNKAWPGTTNGGAVLLWTDTRQGFYLVVHSILSTVHLTTIVTSVYPLEVVLSLSAYTGSTTPTVRISASTTTGANTSLVPSPAVDAASPYTYDY